MKRIISVVLFALALASSINAQSNDSKDLKGLPGVHILVETWPDALKSETLTEKDIQTAAELRLRKAGIRIFASDDLYIGFPTPTLYININATEVDQGRYVISLLIQIRDGVNSRRPPRVSIYASIWQRGYLMSVRSAAIRKLKESVEDIVDEFANLYLEANPKR